MFSLSQVVLHAERMQYPNTPQYQLRGVTIEDFDDGTVTFFSFPGQDVDPDSWQLDTLHTYNDSPFSLKMFGNTWKLEQIDPVVLDTGDVWQVAAYVEELGEIQGFGLGDSAHTLFYSFAGTEQLDIEEWVTVYQGAFPLSSWNLYQLPVGEDWLSYFGYLPAVTGLVFINDKDTDPRAVVYLDEITNITGDLPIAPLVSISYSMNNTYIDGKGQRYVTVQFLSYIYDPDSENHRYRWAFGDDSTSQDPHPLHTYLVKDDHPYTVMLKVMDRTGLYGWATCQVQVDKGETTFPVIINFVGDIMLARRYEDPGGIIDTLGVEAIFDPTLPVLGNAADITVANLECPLTDQGTPHPTKPIFFRGSPENVAGLKHAGIDIVSLANNHIIDYGLEGLKQTQAVLKINDIAFSGAGENSYEAYLPLFYNKAGVNIAFLAFCDRNGQYDNYQPYLNAGFNKPGFAYLDDYHVTRTLGLVKEHADIAIVAMHSGNEYNQIPPIPPYNEETCDEEFYNPYLLSPGNEIQNRHHAIDEGADLVICHHPHVLQGFEVYNGKLIAHSLGNFAFDQTYSETHQSVILNGYCDATGFYDFTITPAYIDDCIPRRAQGELGLHILDYLAQRSYELGTYVLVDRDKVNARIILKPEHLLPDNCSYTKETELQYENGYWVSEPQEVRNRGSITSVRSITPAAEWEYRLGRELIWSGNFEDEGSTVWRIAQSAEFYDSLAYAGIRSLCHVIPQGGGFIATNLEQRIVCYSNSTPYTLYGHIKTEKATDADIVVKFYQYRTWSFSLGACSLSTKIDGTADWELHHKNFVPHWATNYFDIYMQSAPPSTADTGYSWFDNVGIIEWTEWNTWSEASAINSPNDYYWLQFRTTAPIDEAAFSYQETMYILDDETIHENCRLGLSVLSVSPNPCLHDAIFRYEIVDRTTVCLKIFNILGQEVKTLVHEPQNPGPKKVIWNGTDTRGRSCAAGVYFCRLVVGTHDRSTWTRKFILLR
jgi:poly-gamma-glutamate capsule biosynthesis protein CapA/YwtB (metallophosphatase superfamily)